MKVLIFGAGQLARMMYLAGAPLGIDVQAVDVSNEDVVNPVTKNKLPLSLAEALDAADAISVEFEHIPETLLEQARLTGKLLPGKEAILTGADRVREKRLLERLAIPNCAHRIVDNVEQLDQAVDALGDKLILKASRDGYDGYGQWRLAEREDLPALKQTLAALDLKKVPLVVEQMQQFERELSLVGMRSKDGQLKFYPLAENLHHQGQLHVSLAPAPDCSDALTGQAQDIFSRLAEGLDYVGVLAVEFFQVGDQLLVNEIAPRVHNSGHWSMQGADTCQFENHLRAVCGLPLGDTQARGANVMINVIGYDGLDLELLKVPGSHLHWYGKSVRAKRKMAHINLSAGNYKQLGEAMLALADYLPASHFPHVLGEGKKLQAR